MEKILFLIITLLFSSLATAENEAVYNEAEGSIEIPVLSVKGQTEKFSVTLQQEDAEDLIFIITDATPDPEVESSINEATYDPETGVVNIPSVMVLQEGNPSIKSYSVELQLTEESIFKILQAEPILALPTNAFNGIPSETLDISVSEKASSGSSRCTGNPSQNLATARQNFQTKCGEPWNDQKHVCDYKPDGFHCNGNVSASTTPAPSNPTTSNQQHQVHPDVLVTQAKTLLRQGRTLKPSVASRGMIKNMFVIIRQQMGFAVVVMFLLRQRQILPIPLHLTHLPLILIGVLARQTAIGT